MTKQTVVRSYHELYSAIELHTIRETTWMHLQGIMLGQKGKGTHLTYMIPVISILEMTKRNEG